MKTSKVTYAEEVFDRKLATELQYLLEMHKEEVSMFHDVPLKVDWQVYFEAQMKESFVSYIARNVDGLAVGYIGFFLLNHPHYSDLYTANQDVLFLHPDYRKGRAGFALILYAEKELKSRGVNLICQSTKEDKDLSGLFSRLGYDRADIIFTKRL